jgi:hypothetical protein
MLHRTVVSWKVLAAETLQAMLLWMRLVGDENTSAAAVVVPRRQQWPAPRKRCS